MKIPTRKGDHSCKCTELALKRKEGIALKLTCIEALKYSEKHTRNTFPIV